MIIDIRKFLNTEKQYFEELESIISSIDADPTRKLDLNEIKRFHYLYERASSDLAKLNTFSTEPDSRKYLDTLVARSYAIIHETRERPHNLHPVHWFFRTFPRTFRRHIKAFYISLLVTLVGSILGITAIVIDPDAKKYVMPFPHLMQDPSERVVKEENVIEDTLSGNKTRGAAFYMTHNTKVSISTMAMGFSYGIGTLIMLLYTGIMLGAVFADFIFAGYGTFVTGWLLPHGSVEIPAILFAGQAGLMIANAMIGWQKPLRMRERFRIIAPDLVTIISGTAVFLVWAGIIESFFSQYHEPTIPYSIKIIFGSIQLILVILFLSMAGRKAKAQ